MILLGARLSLGIIERLFINSENAGIVFVIDKKASDAVASCPSLNTFSLIGLRDEGTGPFVFEKRIQ